MRKEDYLTQLINTVDEALIEKGLYYDYELSVANSASNIDRSPVLIIDYPDDVSRAYDIPYRTALIDAAESISDINVRDFVDEVMNDITAFESNRNRTDSEYESDESDYDDDYDYDEDDDYEDDEEEYEEDADDSFDLDETEHYHTKDYYKDYDTDYVDEFTQTAKEWLHDYKADNPDKVIDESQIDYEKLNDIYQNNDKSFHKTMKTEISKITRAYTEDFYEDYDTDYVSEFETMARQYIKDNRIKFNMDAEEIAECIDYEELNEEYQENDLSFRETMIKCLEDLGVYKDSEYRAEESENENSFNEESHPLIGFKAGYVNSLSNNIVSDNIDNHFITSLIKRSELIEDIFDKLPIVPEYVNSHFTDDVKKSIVNNTKVTVKSDGFIEITAKNGENTMAALLYIDEILKQIKKMEGYESFGFKIGVPTEDKILAISCEKETEARILGIEKYYSIKDAVIDEIQSTSKPNLVTSNIYGINLETNLAYVIENDSIRPAISPTENDDVSWDIEF